MKNIIIVITICSIFFIIQIDLRLIPLFPSLFTSGFCDNFNALISNLAKGSLISVGFWLLLVYFPEKQKFMKTRNITRFMINQILFKMYIQIGVIFQENEIDTKFTTLKESDLKKINSIEGKMFAYPYQVRTKLKTWLPIEIRNENLIHYLNDENNEIENIIDKIFNLPIVTFEKIEVIETLSKIKHSYFIEKLRKENNSDIIYDGLLYRAIYEYIQWICILDKHVNFQTINKEKFV